MLVTETVIINNREFVRTYSDENRCIIRDGVSYHEAMDPIDTNRTYVEGDIIESIEPTMDLETGQKAIAYDIIMGVVK